MLHKKGRKDFRIPSRRLWFKGAGCMWPVLLGATGGKAEYSVSAEAMRWVWGGRFLVASVFPQ
jgi:hypothetical protein